MNSADFEKRKSKNKIQTFIDKKNSVHTALTIKVWILFWFGYLRKSKRLDFIRHHFACANIMKWSLEGKDIHAMLPYLMRYMGHTGLESTYYYIHLIPDFFSEYSKLTVSTEELIPEVEPYEV